MNNEEYVPLTSSEQHAMESAHALASDIINDLARQLSTRSDDGETLNLVMKKGEPEVVTTVGEFKATLGNLKEKLEVAKTREEIDAVQKALPVKFPYII